MQFIFVKKTALQPTLCADFTSCILSPTTSTSSGERDKVSTVFG